MTHEEIVRRLKDTNAAEVSRNTGLKYRYLRNLIQGEIKNPGSKQIDLLRDYFLSEDVRESRQ